MGLLNIFSKPKAAPLARLHAGSFTIDRHGRVMTSTLPQSFPEIFIQHISQRVLASFRAAEKAQMPLAEIVIHYAALKLLARELRGGAIIFLMPQVFKSNTKAPKAPKTIKTPQT